VIFDKRAMDKPYDRVKRNIMWKLRDTQINETVLYAKRKYGLKLPLIEHKDSDLFRNIISAATGSDWLC
jgi:hypothetical protein